MKYTVESFRNRHKEREAEISRRKNDVSGKYPEIDKVLKDINECAVNSIIGSVSKEQFQREMDTLNARLGDILAEKGYPRDYLELKPECSVCNDIGFTDGRKCECLKRYLSRNKADNAINLFPGSFEEFDAGLFSTKRNGQKNSPKENIIKNRMVAEDFVKNFDDRDSYLGLIFSGEAGTGKTFLAVAAGKAISENHSVICLTAREFEERIKNFSNPNLSEEKNRMYECDLLILDDLGIETQSDFMNGEILKLISDRSIHSRKMIITTNLSLIDIRDTYKSRIYSRLVSDFIFLRFYGDDIRIVKRLKKSSKSNKKG